ncbi:10951_t:CDS:2 [Dentiscutata erythropus]|uniref:10951_t:CDS:1 n=1 Tax=Dentiscutata erythropus TaxID=1348616 RepID=A0A9N9CVN8_9GLOM|nr:10951_t:CDS:2 [Dentiscutata erythropus]
MFLIVKANNGFEAFRGNIKDLNDSTVESFDSFTDIEIVFLNQLNGADPSFDRPIRHEFVGNATFIQDLIIFTPAYVEPIHTIQVTLLDLGAVVSCVQFPRNRFS